MSGLYGLFKIQPHLMKTILLIVISFFIISSFTTLYKKSKVETHFKNTLSINSQSKWQYKGSSTIPDGCGHYIGENFGGGIVFYLDSTACHGLIAAPYDQAPLARWENGIFVFTTLANADGVGAGSGNTKQIIYKQEPHAGGINYAAKICNETVIGAYSDWYLPSKYELNLMYYAIGQGASAPNTNIGNFPEAWYWSSTEADSATAWRQAFYVGLGWQVKHEKFYDFRIRAIRAF